MIVMMIELATTDIAVTAPGLRVSIHNKQERHVQDEHRWPSSHCRLPSQADRRARRGGHDHRLRDLRDRPL